MSETTYTPHGKHLIAGEWKAGSATFTSEPAHGPAYNFSISTRELVDEAAKAAEAAFWSLGYFSREKRAVFLEAIADEIDARGPAITEIGTQETGLPEARLEGERGRTVGQLRLFAEYIRKGDYLDRRHDEALPDRQPLPCPELRMMQRPIGPVAVFGASNFPLAFSTAGRIPHLRLRQAVRWWSKVIPHIPEPARSLPKQFMQPLKIVAYIPVFLASFKEENATSGKHWYSIL